MPVYEHPPCAGEGACVAARHALLLIAMLPLGRMFTLHAYQGPDVASLMASPPRSSAERPQGRVWSLDGDAQAHVRRRA
jgi:hypothetical protein